MVVSIEDMQILKKGGNVVINKKIQIRSKHVARCGVDKVDVICTYCFSSDFRNYTSSVEIPKED